MGDLEAGFEGQKPRAVVVVVGACAVLVVDSRDVEDVFECLGRLRNDHCDFQLKYHPRRSEIGA